MSRVAVGLLALAVLIGAGLYTASQIRDQLSGAAFRGIQDSEPGSDAQPAVEEGLDRSVIVVGSGGGRPVVSLSKTEALSETRPQFVQGLLVRELFRQALLIAARDGLGASIRDEALGEPLASTAAGPGLELRHGYGRDGKVSVSLRRPGSGGEVLWSGDFALPPGNVVPMERLLQTLEPMTRGGLVEALKKQGIWPAVAKRPESGAVPESVAGLVDRMTFVSQYAAIRALSETAPSNPSAEPLGAMVRSYANLGVLTEHHWSAAHKAFEARALLYAYRLVALHPDSPSSFWNRAYALGMIGLHAEALADLEQADRKVAKLAAGRRPAAPPWVALVGMLCRSDTRGLLGAATDPALAPMASILALMTVERSASTSLALEVARIARKANPDCLWVNDAACQVRKLSHLHVATVEGLTTFDRVVPAELRKLAGLPEAVADRLKKGEGEASLVKALVAEGSADRDRVEPSWAVLGRMVLEARFAQVARRVEFMVMLWNVPAGEFVNQVRPLVSEHPFWPLLQACTVDRESDGGATLQRLLQIPSQEIEPQEHFYFFLLRAFGVAINEPGPTNFRAAINRADFVARDRAAALRNPPKGGLPDAARNLLVVSPDSPIGMAALIDQSWDEAIRSRPDPETTYAQHPEVLVALGKHYAASKRPEDAERVLSAAIKTSPDQESYAALASVYRSLGQMDRWKETLDAFLAEDDPGLDHAKVQVEIARYYMGRKEYPLALPYAEAAAQTWAGWALQCAGECAELMGEWERAEYWYRGNSERYASSRMNWFYFCVRTGHGDRAAASEPMEQFIAAQGESAGVKDLEAIGVYHILTRSPEKAREAFRKIYERERANPSGPAEGLFAGLHLAVIADRLGDAGLRDQTLGEIAKAFEPQAPRMSRICGLLRDWLARPEPDPSDFARVDEVYASMPEPARGSIGYYVGQLLDQHGQKEKALKYHGDSAKGPMWMQYLSTNALRDRGIKVGPGGVL